MYHQKTIREGFTHSFPSLMFFILKMKQPFKPEDLEKLKNLNYEEGSKLLKLVPLRQLMNLYASYLEPDKILALFTEWENTGNIKKILGLCKALKRKNKELYIPYSITEKYL